MPRRNSTGRGCASVRLKKSFILPIVILLVFLAGSVQAENGLDPLEIESETEIIELDSQLDDAFELIAENDHLKLYLNSDLVEFAVYVKQHNQLWYSNPPLRATEETLVSGSSKRRLNAQLAITYEAANSRSQLDSYNDSVAHGQYEITPISNGVRITYRLGKQWEDRAYLPTIISRAALDELLAMLPASDKSLIDGMYVQFQLEKDYIAPDEIAVHGVDMDKILNGYGIHVDESLRAPDRRRLFQEYLNGIRSGRGYTSLGSITHEDIQGIIDTPTMLLKWDIKQWDLDDAIEILKESGYSPTKNVEHHQAYNFLPPFANIETFKVAVEYVLDGEDFVARVLGDSIEYPEKVKNPKTGEIVSYPLTSISLLNYFGAASMGADGYILVPDGSGGLIEFYDKGSAVQPYNKYVYGRDLASAPIPEYSPSLETSLHFPVFGLKNGDDAFLAIIEEGDAMARLEAVVAGMRDSYSRAWVTFSYLPYEKVQLSDSGWDSLTMNMYQSRPYQGDMSVRYSFLKGDEASYVGMAKHLRNYLVSRHEFAQDIGGKGLPLLLDVVGGIDRIAPVLGIPSVVVEPVTTYSQAQSLIEDLQNSGVPNLMVRYQGWLKGGINHVLPKKVKLERLVGNKKELEIFVQFLTDKEIPLYPDVSFSEVRNDGLLNGFIKSRDASYFLNRRVAYKNTHNICTYQPIDDQRKWLVSPARMPSLMGSFTRSYKNYDIPGLSVGHLGYELYSDFRTKQQRLVDRQQALEIITGELATMKADGLMLMADRANKYLLPYLQHISDVPLYTSGLQIVDQSIPFYQMVLSGLVTYSAPAANLVDQDGVRYLLKLLETGSAPSFTVAHAVSAKVKHTQFNDLYSINYDDLKRDILALYAEASAVLDSLWCQEIIDHKVLTDEVFLTQYADGTTIIVNYGKSSYRLDDVTVPPEGYRVLQ